MILTRRETFNERCWRVCRRIPAGRVATYGTLAEAMGNPGAARAVGRAMAMNPYAPDVPCHRVVASDGRLTGYSGEGGVAKKAAMLETEGVPLRKGRVAITAAVFVTADELAAG